MLENIRLSFQGIWSHKMRSFLTMLGIIIGIAAIIAIVSTIQGTNEQIKRNLIGSGTNTVRIQLYNGSYPIDPTYETIPSTIPVISEEVKQQILDLKEVNAVTLYHQRQDYNAVFYVGIPDREGKGLFTHGLPALPQGGSGGPDPGGYPV